MIGLFTGTAAAATSSSSTAAGQDSAEGFGATLLEEITAAVAGTPAESTATPGVPVGVAQVAAPLPTAAELLAALSTGFTGTIAPSPEATVPVTADSEGEADDTAAATDSSLVTPSAAPGTEPAAITPPAVAPSGLAGAINAVLPPVGGAAAPAAATPESADVVAPAPAAAATATATAVAAAASAQPAVVASAAGATPRTPVTPVSTASPASPASTAISTPTAPTGDAPLPPGAVVGEAPIVDAVALAAVPRAVAATPGPAAAVPTTPTVTAPPVAPVAAADTASAADPLAAPKDGVAPVTLMPAVQTASVTATVSSGPVATPVAAPVPLATQVTTPIFTLAAAGAGEHVMTIDITPENLGPITVRAHVGADGVRVELFAPNDGARDALRAILPDIRKDMGGAGLGSNLDLSSQNQPADRGSEGDGQRRQPRGEASTVDSAADAAAPWKLTDPSTTIDVMA